MALEEVKFLQKQRERKSGIPAISSTSNNATSQTTTSGGAVIGGLGYGLGFSKVGNNRNSVNDTNIKNDATDAEKEDLVLQDNFAQETAVMVEDPNM